MPDQSRPLRVEAGHTSRQMVLVATLTLAAGLRCSDLCHEQRRHKVCVFSSGMGLRVGTAWPMTQVSLGSCLPPGRSRGWKHWIQDHSFGQLIFEPTKQTLQPREEALNLPGACQQRLQTAMAADGDQHKQPPEKGSFMVSGRQLLDWQGHQLCVAREGAGRCSPHTCCCGPKGARGTAC